MSRQRSWVLVWGMASVVFAPHPAVALPERYEYGIVLGQEKLGQRRPNGTDPGSFSSPLAVAVDRSRRPSPLYVADAMNGRVLAWRDATSFRNGAPADLIIGQPDGISGERYRSDAASISRPTALAVDHEGTLWVADADNGRVLGFRWPFDPQRSRQDNLTADFLIGQPEFGLGYRSRACNGTTPTQGPGSPATDQTLCEPSGLAIDPMGNLYVADRLNHRVLMFRGPLPDRYARAQLVLGQDALEGTARCNRSAMMAPPHSRSLCEPQGLALDVRQTPLRLFVADSGNHRVLVFNDPWNDQEADFVFGQMSLHQAVAGTGMDRFNRPSSVTVDGAGRVWVSDAGNHRVLGFEPPYEVPGPVASYLIGQVDGNGTQPNQTLPGRPTAPPTATTLFAPRGGAFDDLGRLLLADAGNHRVLAYAMPARVNAVATSVLGQADFVHGAESRTDAATLAYPVGVAVDRPDPRERPGEPQAVYVADFGNSRILAWRDLYALRSGRPADLVIGQKGMLDHACNQGRGISASTLCWPRGVAVDRHGDLWVADTWNHRVLRFPKPFARKGEQVANLVLGQPGFLGGLYNINAVPQPTRRSMSSPAAVAVEPGGVVWVADRDNNRVLGFAPPLSNGMQATYVLVGEDLGPSSAGCPRGGGGFICGPTGLAWDPSGGLWVADRDNNRVSLYATRPDSPDSPLISPVPRAVIGQPSITATAPNLGDPTRPTASSLMAPESVSVEVRLRSDGTPEATAIVVADSGNHRVLVFDPLTSGFQPEAKQVIGQAGSFERQGANLDADFHDRMQNVERGLFNPGAVLALPEVLLISDSGDTSRLSVRTGALQPTLGDTGNNRVLLLLGPDFPRPADPPDMLPEAPDMAMTEPAPEPMSAAGCACDLGRGAAPGPAGALLGLLLALVAIRSTSRRAP
ncbi:MAG: NHL repeat-containing protein [Myxococcales bacterium]|nr:NHL repeat-containing protein [Myxococcota bacterium]MDW8280975.1 NHL repeat-containing protein [Myxococcales bacterium]